MNSTGVTTFDIVCWYLEPRNSSHSCSCSDEDIRLVDTCRHMTIWVFDPNNSLCWYIRTIYRECEYIKCWCNIITTDFCDDLDIDGVYEDTCSQECSICSHFDMAIFFFDILFFLPDKTIWDLYSRSYVDIDMSDRSNVVDITIFSNANICIIYFYSFHRGKYRKNIWKCNWLFRVFSIKYMYEYRDTRNRSWPS